MCCDRTKLDNNLHDIKISIFTDDCDIAIVIKQFLNEYGKK